MFNDSFDILVTDDSVNTKQSNLRELLKVILQSSLIFFTVWQFSRLSEQVQGGLISLSNDLFDPLVYIRSVFVLGLPLFAITYYLLPNNLKETIRLLIRAQGRIKQIEKNRENLSVEHRNLLNYAMRYGATSVDHIVSQAFSVLKGSSSGKFSIGSPLPGGGPWSDERVLPIIKTIRTLTPTETEALNSVLYDYWFTYRRLNYGGVNSDYEYLSNSSIDKSQLDEVSQMLGIIPSEYGYSIRPNNFGLDWLIEIGDKRHKDFVESRDTEEEAEVRAKELADQNALPFQGFWGRR